MMQLNALPAPGFFNSGCMNAISMSATVQVPSQGSAFPSNSTIVQPEQGSNKKRKGLESHDVQQQANKLRMKETLTGSSASNRPPLAIKPPKNVAMFPGAAGFPMSPMPFGLMPTPFPPGPPLPAGMTWGVPAPPPALLMSMMSAMSGGFPSPMSGTFPFPMAPMGIPSPASTSTAAPGNPSAFLTQQMQMSALLPTMQAACMQPGLIPPMIPSSVPVPTSPLSPSTAQFQSQTTSQYLSQSTSQFQTELPSPTAAMSQMSTESSLHSELSATSAPSANMAAVTGAGVQGLVTSTSSPCQGAQDLVPTPSVSNIQFPAASLVPALLDENALSPTGSVPCSPVKVGVAESTPLDILDSLPLLPTFKAEPGTLSPRQASCGTSGQVFSGDICSADVSRIDSFGMDKVGSPGAESGDSSFTDCLSELGMMGELDEGTLMPMDWLFEVDDDDDEASRPVDLSCMGLGLKKTGSFVDLINDSLWCSSACSAS